MADETAIPPSILDADADRLARALDVAADRAKMLDEVRADVRSESGRIAAGARWSDHEHVPTTPLRVATAIVERIKAEVPKPERRAFVDGALLSALNCTHVKDNP